MENDNSNLKLLGKSAEDLKIISAYLQDSIVTIKDVVFLKSSKTFLMIVNRFMWEDVEKGLFRDNKRIRCAVKFCEVYKVISKNINQLNKNKALELLTIKVKPLSNFMFKIQLIFSGGSIITIFSEELDVLIDDQGKPWVAKSTPKHKV